jgi:diguanylate cyclase (GGDEF)-like protein
VGTADGLFRLNGKSVRQFKRADGLVNGAILSLAESHDGSLWIGTNAGGAYRLRGEHVDSVGSKLGLGVASVRSIAETADGSIWLGTNTGLYQFRQNAMVRLLRTADGLPSDQVISLHEDSIHQLWVGTRDGVALIDVEGRVRAHPELGQTARILSISETTEGAIVVSTGNGFALVSQGKATRFEAAQGVPGRSYFSAIDDGQGHLWLCSNQGLVQLAKRELDEVTSGQRTRVVARLFGRSEGMATAQCNGGSEPAGWRMRDGRLLFATARGVAVVQATVNRQVELGPPPVHITAIDVDAESMPLGKRVDMAPGKHRIEISYVGLNYAEPEKVSYRYRLHGFDADWVNVGSMRRAIYTNLQPGRYRFQVQAANADGVWNELGAALEVAYRPHFWQQAWFQLVSALAIIGIALSVYLARVRQLNQQALSLRELVDERTRDLEREKQKLEAANDEKAQLLVQVKDQSEAYERLSKQDSLTGLANRRELDRRLGLEFERAWRNHRPLCVALADLDFFKSVNDTASHAVGDDVLRIVSRILLDGCRAIDLVARYGGEEFAIVLPETDIADAILLCERLREEVAGYDWDSIHPQLNVTLSLGIADNHLRDVIVSHDKLLDAADERLYAAKRQGRNRVCA